MSRYVKLLVSLTIALQLRGVAAAQMLVDITPAAFSAQSVIVNPGAFRVVEPEDKVIGMCAQMGGIWRHIQLEPTPCPISQSTARPPEDLLPTRPPRIDDKAVWVIGNLGITSAQWAQAKTTADGSAAAVDNLLTMISQAADVRATANYVRWSFDSGRLPRMITAPIPGSGIYYHIENYFSQAYAPRIFDDGTRDLLVQVKLSVPDFRVSGSATSTITIGLAMQTEDLNGRLSPLPLIVSLFHSRGDNRESTSMDRDLPYAVSPLSEKATFIIPVDNRQRSGTWPRPEVYSFRIDRTSIGRLIAATNALRVVHGYPPLDDRPALVRFKGVDLRNENRFLNEGSVHVGLDTEYLRVVRETE